MFVGAIILIAVTSIMLEGCSNPDRTPTPSPTFSPTSPTSTPTLAPTLSPTPSIQFYLQSLLDIEQQLYGQVEEINHRLSAAPTPAQTAAPTGAPTEAPTVGPTLPTKAPPNSALIVVDMQNDFISGSLQVPDAESIIGQINSLIALPGWNSIVFTMDYHPQDHLSFAENSPFNRTKFSFVDAAYDKNSRICGTEYVDLYGGSAAEKCDESDVEVNFSQELWPVHCVQGTWGQKIDDRVQIPVHATIVKKGFSAVVDSYGAFEDNFVFESKAAISPNAMSILSENNLAKMLKLADVENVYMTGLALDYCVKYTAMQALDRNFNTYLVEDATKAVIEEQGLQAIAHLQHEGVEIVNASAV